MSSDLPSLRMTEPGKAPTPRQVQEWIGKEPYDLWTRVAGHIRRSYPDVFTPEWLFGGKKHGWSLRYKKGKSFCTFIPERSRFALLIVFGADERAKVETMRREVSPQTMKRYDEATTYHDGKWLLLAVDSDKVVGDVERLLAVKRQPRPGKKAAEK